MTVAPKTNPAESPTGFGIAQPLVAPKSDEGGSTFSPQLLLQHFGVLAETPGAVPRLRQFILELAVQGKLVDRNREDEPASELLTRIQAEKARRTKAGELKKQEPLPKVTPEEAFFEIPAGWEWGRLGEITQVVMGQSPPGETYNKSGEGIPLINGPVEFTEGPFGRTVVNQYTTDPTNVCEEGDLLLCVRGSTTGRTNIAGFRACIGRGVAAIRPFFDDGYVRLFIWRLRASIIAMGRGIAFPSVNKEQIEKLPIPIPPLAEQRRILAKVEELLALCDELEARQTTAREHRTRLVHSSFSHLTGHSTINHQPSTKSNHLTAAEDEAAFKKHSAFCLQHSELVFDSVPALRQAVLSLAVQGRLVPQNPKDEPASKLLESISDELIRLEKRGLIKREAAVNVDVTPFAIPENWKWVRLGEITELITKGSSPKWQGIDYISKHEGLLFITSENVGNYRLRKLDELKYVDKRFNVIEARSILRYGDILMNLVGASIGRTAVYDLHDVANINQAVALIRLTQNTPNLFAQFLLHYLNSPSAIQTMMSSQVITAQPNISLTNVREFPIPVPPLAEQMRIVAKVDELMRWCDALEARLAEAQTTATHLLDATLHHILSA